MMLALTLAFALVATDANEPNVVPPPPPQQRTPAKGTVAIGSQATTTKGWSFMLSVGDCKAAKGAPKDAPADCAVYVSLGKSKKERLPWAAKAGSIFKQSETSVAIGDESDTALAVSWAPVTVAKGIDGIIVSLMSGGDRVKRHHDVFLSKKGKLDYAFTANEPRGSMTWSTVTALDMDGNGGAELLMMNAARPDEEEADRWNLDVYGYRADVGKIVKLPTWAPTIHAAMVGSFNNIKEARELQADKCLRDFIVVDSKSAPLLAPGSFVIVYPSATHSGAAAALDAAKACSEDVSGGVKIIARGMDAKQDE